MFLEKARRYDLGFKVFRPFAPVGDRHAWSALPAELRRELVETGEKYLNFNYPLIPADRFMMFSRNGNRTMLQELYSERRRVLNALVVAECVEDRGRFIDDIINGIMAVCEESGWQYHAHNWKDPAPDNHVYRSEYHPLPDIQDPVMDHASCDTSASMAMVLYLLRERLDKVTPLIAKRVTYELKQRTLYPYLDKYFWWIGDWSKFTNNWTPWCTQNTLACLLSLDDTEVNRDTKQRVLERAAKSLDIFLEGYGDDGCCNEGAGYYHAAALTLFNAIEVLNAVTDGYFNYVYEQPKIKNMAPYIMNMHVRDGYYINFADCSPTPGRTGVREYLFAKRVGNENMMRFAAADYKAGNSSLSGLPHHYNLYYYLQAIFNCEEVQNFDTGPAIQKDDVYYESAGVLVARDDRFTLGVKAGNNDDSHNHNDVGSVTVYRDGKPMLIDVGVETYTLKTFSPERYELWTMQSAYHNVVTFGDVMQCDGRTFAASDVRVRLDAGKAAMTMELAGAYPAGTVKSYRRSVVLEKGKEIRLTDTLSEPRDGAFLTLMCVAKPRIDGNTIRLDDRGTLTVDGAFRADVETIGIVDPKLLREWGDTLYRVRIYFLESEITLNIK